MVTTATDKLSFLGWTSARSSTPPQRRVTLTDGARACEFPAPERQVAASVAVPLRDLSGRRDEAHFGTVTQEQGRVDVAAAPARPEMHDAGRVTGGGATGRPED